MLLSARQDQHNSVALKVDALVHSGSAKGGGSFRIPAINPGGMEWGTVMLPSPAPKTRLVRSSTGSVPKVRVRKPPMTTAPVTAPGSITHPRAPFVPKLVASNRVSAASGSRVSAVEVPPRVRDQRRHWTASENAIVNTRNDLIQKTCKETNQVKEKQSFCVKVITDLLGGKRDWKERGTGVTQISRSVLSKLEKEYQKTPDKIQKQLEKLAANKKVLQECVRLRRLQTQVYAEYGMDDLGHAAYIGVEEKNAKECQKLHDQLQAISRRMKGSEVNPVIDRVSDMISRINIE
ncbi:hypothetical protein ABBQ32_011349 [Trebouxia sp. C0010 RCD-2024]